MIFLVNSRYTYAYITALYVNISLTNAVNLNHNKVLLASKGTRNALLEKPIAAKLFFLPSSKLQCARMDIFSCDYKD